MALRTSCQALERIANTIGFEATVTAAAFFGGHGKAVYVPRTPDPAHLLAKVIGFQAFEKLVKEFGGQALAIPMLDLSPVRNAGRVYAARIRNLSSSETAQLVGLTGERVRQITAQLRLEGFFELAADLDPDGGKA